MLFINGQPTHVLDRTQVITLINEACRPLRLVLSKPTDLSVALIRSREDPKKQQLDRVLHELERALPILSSFIDEHCMFFGPGIATEESAHDLFAEYDDAASV